MRIVFRDERESARDEEGNPMRRPTSTKAASRLYAYMNKEKDPSSDIIYVNSEKDGVRVEAALQYSDAYSDNILGFANNIRTVDGGTHIEGLKTVLTRTLNAFAKSASARSPIPTSLAKTSVRVSPRCCR